MQSWKEIIVKTIDLITEDKLVAMACLTLLGCWAINKYPVADSLPALTAIVGGISGFVVGRNK